MNFNEVLDTIKMLANSQGFYGRLYRNIMELPADELESLKEDWTGKFNDALDFIMYIEG